MDDLKSIITQAFLTKEQLTPQNTPTELLKALDLVMNKLSAGELRVATKESTGWLVHDWLKQAILLYFRTHKIQPISGGFTQFFDKIPLQYQNFREEDWARHGVRIVPPATIRVGSFIGKNSVVMPSYINIGAYVGENSMVDIWATLGSCAQIGNNVHLSMGVGIGGVLEPLQEQPTIIEDDVFVGAGSQVVEGVIVEEGSVIGMGVCIGKSTKIYDVARDTISYGVIPQGSVVIPGSLPAQSGRYNTNAAIIIKKVTAETRKKVTINELLRICD